MGIPQQAASNRQPREDVTDSATVTLDYFGSTVVATAAGAETLTIPADLFLGLEDECSGLAFDVIQGGAGAFTIAGTGGAVVNGNAGDVATNGQHARITVTVLGPNAYNVSGDRT